MRVHDFYTRTKTHKALGIDEVVQDALTHNVDTLIVISSGNYVSALVNEIERQNLEQRLHVVNLVNKPMASPCREVHIPPGRI